MGLFDLLKKISAANKPSVLVKVSAPSIHGYEQQANIEAEESAKLDANCRRSEHGLTVSQILLLEYCKKGKYPNPEGGYPRFWWTDYGLRSVGDVLKTLESTGFIKCASPLEIVSTLKVGELKKILADNNLSTAGKKSDFIDRIEQNLSDKDVAPYIHGNKYILTELGNKELSDNEYVIYMHSHKWPEISIWDVNKNADLKHWRDYIWGKFNQCSMEYMSKGQWGLYRNVKLYMADFLYDEARYTDAYVMYGEVCYLDVNGLDIFIDYDDPADLIPDGIIQRMSKAAREGNIDREKQNDLLRKTMDRCQAVKQRVSNDKMADLIMRKLGLM